MQDRTILAKILEFHGGVENYQRLESMEVTMSARGFLFWAKGIQTLKQTRLKIYTQSPLVTIYDFPKPGHFAKFVGEEEVAICDPVGRVLQSRRHPREMFGKVSRLFRWDDLDFAYFCGYAMWNYMNAPFLFQRTGVEVLDSSELAKDSSSKLTVRYPDSFPTHSQTQEYIFDKYGQLLRHNYVAQVVGSWAKASHLCDCYRRFGALNFPTKRRVHPKIFGRVLQLVTFVAIDVHDVVLIEKVL